MEKKPMMYTQQRIDFERPASDEVQHVAVATSQPPPANHKQKAPPLVRSDRQLTYDGLSHEEWPDAALLHDQDTITVDRIVEDIDGPAHRFVIKRGDFVEAYLAPEKFQVGEVIGINHARQEVQVACNDSLENGGWLNVGRIYPVAESLKEPSRSLRERRQSLSHLIASVNGQYGSGLTEANRVPAHAEPPPVKINDRLVIVPIGFKESRTSERKLSATNVEPARPTYTFDEFKAFFRAHSLAPVPFESFKATFSRIWESQDALKSELSGRFNAKELQILASRFGSWDAKRKTKDQNAASIVQKMLGYFVLEGGVSYSPFSGENYELALKKNVESITAGEYARHFNQRKEESIAKEKALTNPETFYEFRTFILENGEEALSDEQLARYDALHAEQTRERRKSEMPATVTKFQNEELQQLSFEMKTGYHDKRQCPLYIVQLNSRVERDAFNELNRKAKMLGGWWSSFKKSDAGFQFLEKDYADRFCSLLTADADRSAVLESRKERKELSAAERMHELASELHARAEATIEQSNGSLQNTARRADIQAGIRGRAYADQAFSGTIQSIADALKKGTAKYLDGIRHKTQLETLDTVLSLAKWARVRAVRKAEAEGELAHARRLGRIEDEPVGPTTIRHVEYPFPCIYKRNLDSLIERSKTSSGVKLAAEKMRKRLVREKDDCVTFTSERDIELLADFLARAKARGLDIERVEDAFEKYKRLRKANIYDIHELRAALREYLAHRAEARGDDPVRVAERELIGKDLPGFFPTPRPVIERMLELASIDRGQRVLEPSCGKGDILDILKEECPDIELQAIERNYSLSDVLSAKGHAVTFADFLEHNELYDRIVQNPPFEQGQDIDHVRHAYSLLRPGGRLVSVVCEGPFFRGDSKSVAFRDWLEEVNADIEQLPDDAFQGREAFRQTGVRTRLVTITKQHLD